MRRESRECGTVTARFGIGIALAACQQPLKQLLDTFDMFPDPADRTDMLLSYADQFREVPADVATRPFPKSHQVPQCESDAYVWAMKQPDGTLTLHFAVENPSGVSARALAAILERTLSGLTPADIARVDSPHRRAHLPAEHLDGQGHGADVDGRGRTRSRQQSGKLLTPSDDK